MIIDKFRKNMDFLAKAKSLGIKPGLTRIKTLLELLDNPHANITAIHIAGTNGKGSTSSFCAYIAACCDYKVGWFTSPYLERFNERIRIIDGQKGLDQLLLDETSSEISDDDFASCLDTVLDAARIMAKQNKDLPSEFELLTAVAFLYFKRRACDFLVIETGLGGRLDSTNVMDHPLATIITSLSYDHMDRLGNTLEQIAQEKAGIIKSECPVILSDLKDTNNSLQDQKKATTMIYQTATSCNSPVTSVSMADIEIISQSIKGQIFIYHGDQYSIKLAGDYQVQNACLAIEACKLFADKEAIKEGLSRAEWHGRNELINEFPIIVLDGAHNLAGAQALHAYLSKFLASQKLIYLSAILRDKQSDQMLQELLIDDNYQVSNFIAVQVANDRSMTALELAEKAYQYGDFDQILELTANCIDNDQDNYVKQGKVEYTSDIELAVKHAVKLAFVQRQPLIVCGSLYLIGQVRSLIKKAIADFIKDNQK